MTFRKMSKDEQLEPGDKWLSVTQGMSGYFAVLYWVNDEGNFPFTEPYDTGIGRYSDIEKAKAEALWIAEEFDLPYYFD